MTILVVTLLVVVSLAVLTYPFVARRSAHDGFDDEAEELAQRLRRARDRVYEEIRALQQEYFLHNLTEEEYREQLRAARLQAADLLRQQQGVRETMEAIDQTVEAAMQRAALAAPRDVDGKGGP